MILRFALYSLIEAMPVVRRTAANTIFHGTRWPNMFSRADIDEATFVHRSGAKATNCCNAIRAGAHEQLQTPRIDLSDLKVGKTQCLEITEDWQHD